MTIVYILIAILMFGVLIAVHEFGHFIVAKLLGVRVNEFAIGMGPQIFSRQKGETVYSLRAFPVGGFCAMEGEEEKSNDPRAFSNKPAWKKFLILVAGAFMNFVVGVLLILVLFSQNEAIYTPVISSFADGFPLQGEQGLLPGDRIVRIDGHRVLVYDDVTMFFSRAGSDGMDLEIERDGRRLTLENLPLAPREYTDDGQTVVRYGINFTVVPATLGASLRNGLYQSVDFVRLVWISLGDLITGAVGVKDMSGPVGIVAAMKDMGEAGAEAAGAAGALANILYFTAFIAINLAVMNLLPIPALDGGQILFLIVNGIWHFFTRKRIDDKYLAYVNMAGFFCLIALMVVVAFNDVIKLVR